MTHYQVLGLSRSATSEEIRKSYRRLVMRYHPDRNPDPSASDKFLRVQRAYEVLIHPGLRENYDYSLNVGSILNKKPLSRAEQKDPGYRRSRMSQQMRPDSASKKKGKTQDAGDFRMLENVLFYSLLMIGFIAIFFSARDLWYTPWDDLNKFTGITFGISFTVLLIYSWTQIYRKKE
jgi:curved DNA-binding protein CbpA